MEELKLSQILLITDGCSNVGLNPIEAAKFAREEGHVVNVIGVVDQGELGEYGAQEIREIAIAGGGMSRIVTPKLLSQTVQLMTRQAITRTIHGAVNRELKQILNGTTIEELPPKERSQVVEAMDTWNETSELQLVILIDTSLSMKPKLKIVAEAIKDLTLSLQARKGSSYITVLSFPGKKETIEIRMDWTREVSNLQSLYAGLNMSGTTPTGPAIMEAIQHFHWRNRRRSAEPLPKQTETQEGWMQEYVF